MTDEEFLDFLTDECHYLSARIMPTGKWSAVMPLMSTWAVITGEVGDTTGYSDRWCYDSPYSAALALTAWNGEGEPIGWHRHPSSGRRIARGRSEYDDMGREVPIGQEYVRR